MKLNGLVCQGAGRNGCKNKNIKEIKTISFGVSIPAQGVSRDKTGQ